MKINKRGSFALSATVLMLTGCGSTEIEPDSEPDSSQVAAERTSAATATPSATASSATPLPPAGAPTTIPAAIRLPHEGTWAVNGIGSHLTPLPEICIDPPAKLNDVQPTDARALYDPEARAAPSESLGVYVDDAAATEAVDDWRQELALCGAAGPQSHTGEPVEWFVVKADIPGSDEAWQAYELSEDVGGKDQSGKDPFVTVARVGNAIFVETFLHPGHLDTTSIEASSRQGSMSVASFLPVLQAFES